MTEENYFLLVWADVAILGIAATHALRGTFRLSGITWDGFRRDAWVYSFALSASQFGQILWLFFLSPRTSGDGGMATAIYAVLGSYPLSFAAPLVALLTTNYRKPALCVGLGCFALTWVIPFVVAAFSS